MKKRILSLALIIGLFASFSICAYAQDGAEFTPENPDYLVEEELLVAKIGHRSQVLFPIQQR